MGGSFKIDHGRRANFVTWDGEVRADDILEAMLALHRDPAFDPGYDTLCDYTAVNEVIMVAQDMNRLLDTMAAHDMRCGRTAMVMPSTGGLKNVGKVMSAALKERGFHDHKTFDNFVEAEVWLGMRDFKGMKKAPIDEAGDRVDR